MINSINDKLLEMGLDIDGYNNEIKKIKELIVMIKYVYRKEDVNHSNINKLNFLNDLNEKVNDYLTLRDEITKEVIFKQLTAERMIKKYEWSKTQWFNEMESWLKSLNNPSAQDITLSKFEYYIDERIKNES